MNEKRVHCRACEIELVGSKRNGSLTLGDFVYLITRDSKDCNWHRCTGCKNILCKKCYVEQRTYCCEADYIAQRERAQMLADQYQNQTTINQEDTMSDHKIVYLIVERGIEPNRQTFWRSAGNAFICRDGSLNVKLDIHPGLTFNIRDPRSNGERQEAEPFPNQGNGNGHAEAEPPVSSTSKRTGKAMFNGATRMPPLDDIPF